MYFDSDHGRDHYWGNLTVTTARTLVKVFWEWPRQGTVSRCFDSDHGRDPYQCILTVTTARDRIKVLWQWPRQGPLSRLSMCFWQWPQQGPLSRCFDSDPGHCQSTSIRVLTLVTIKAPRYRFLPWPLSKHLDMSPYRPLPKFLDKTLYRGPLSKYLGKCPHRGPLTKYINYLQNGYFSAILLGYCSADRVSVGVALPTTEKIQTAAAYVG